MSISTIVVATRMEAEDIIERLEAVGITDSQISVVMSDKTRGAHFGLKESSKVEEGVTVGATTGGIAGAIAGAVLAAGAIAIPGMNLIVAGALAPALAGLGAGGVAGGLIGGPHRFPGIPRARSESLRRKTSKPEASCSPSKRKSDDQAKRWGGGGGGGGGHRFQPDPQTRHGRQHHRNVRAHLLNTYKFKEPAGWQRSPIR